MTESSNTRQLEPLLAFVASLVGLGFVYVGWIRTAVAIVLGPLAVLVLFGWLRFIFHPAFLYLLAGLLVFIFAMHLIVPTVIAVRHKQAPNPWYNRWWLYVVWIVAGMVLAELNYAYRPAVTGYNIFRAPSVSMSPTLLPGDMFITDTWRFRKHPPVYGEIVVFNAEGGMVFVKRLIGLPGDRIEIRNAVVYRNGESLHEPYLHAPRVDAPYGRDVDALQLGPTEYYVLGDNRDNSNDSRRFGPVDASQLHGRAEYIWFSITADGIQWNRFPKFLAEQQ